MEPVSADPRTWETIVKKEQPRPYDRYRQAGVWVTNNYIAFSDDVIAFMRRPLFIHLKRDGRNIAIFACAADTPGAISVCKKSASTRRGFYHAWIPTAQRQVLKSGVRPSATFLRSVGSEPFILIEDAYRD